MVDIIVLSIYFVGGQKIRFQHGTVEDAERQAEKFKDMDEVEDIVIQKIREKHIGI